MVGTSNISVPNMAIDSPGDLSEIFKLPTVSKISVAQNFQDFLVFHALPTWSSDSLLLKIAIEIVDLSIQNGDVPWFFVYLPEGVYQRILPGWKTKYWQLIGG